MPDKDEEELREEIWNQVCSEDFDPLETMDLLNSLDDPFSFL